MESMNAQSSMAHNARTMQTKRVKWKDINWIIAESYVNRLQVRIVKAVQKDKWRLVKRCLLYTSGGELETGVLRNIYRWLRKK